jgi:hypothetical protein
MSQTKGKVPAHIQPKKFHPSSTTHIILILSEVEGSRKPSCNFQYFLTTILFISLVGILCGAKDGKKILQAVHGMGEWTGRYVDIASGIPSSQIRNCQKSICINNLSVSDVQKRSEFMEWRALFAENMQHFPFVQRQSICDQRSMTTPGHCLCAHDGGWTLFSECFQLFKSFLK